MSDFPQGDGDPGCPKCGGRGVVDYKSPRSIVPGTLVCSCVRERDILHNLERGWRGLTKARPVEATPLSEYAGQDLWVTSPLGVFRNHLYRVAYDQGPRWPFNLFSDADLMDSWLSRVEVHDIYDTDVFLERARRSAVSGRFAALVDLVDPPGLLILRVGVKVARNAAMPEVLLEGLRHREQVSKPTWVVDSPGNSLGEGHVSYNEPVGEFLSDWDHITLSGKGVSVSQERAGDSESAFDLDLSPATRARMAAQRSSK